MKSARDYIEEKDIQEDIKKRAIEIVEEYKEDNIISRSRRVLGSSAVYIASLDLGKRLTQRNVADIFNTTEVSIQNTWKSIVEEIFGYVPHFKPESEKKILEYLSNAKKDKIHKYRISKELDVSDSTVYINIPKMERKGLIASSELDETTPRNKEKVKGYSITPKGLKLLNERKRISYVRCVGKRK